MTAKEYLSQIPKLNRLVHRLYDTVQMMHRDLVCFSSSLNPDKIPTTSSGGDSISAFVARVVDLEQEMRKQIEKLAQQKAEAYQKIQALPDLDWQNVLLARYFQELSWKEIAVTARHDERWGRRKHGEALLALQKILDADGPPCPVLPENARNCPGKALACRSKNKVQ